MNRLWLLLYTTCLLWCAPLSAIEPDVDLDRLDDYIARAVKEFELTGLTIAIVKDNEIIFSNGYGLRNAETGEPATPRSLFNIASCTKAMTAACMALLVDEGKLNWDAKVVDFIPGFQLADPYITSRLNMVDILTHRSGLGTFYGDLLWYETDYSNEEVIRRMRYLPITNDFRSEFGYQNNMYMIAGEIIEDVSEQSWSAFMYERLFSPLEMKNSRTCSQDLQDGQEIAYPHIDGALRPLYIEDPGPAGSVYSSAMEMANWIIMLLEKGQFRQQQVLEAKTVDALFTPHTISKVPRLLQTAGVHFYLYGLGWNLFDYSGSMVAEHSGGMPGYISRVVLVPEERLGMVILTNDLNILPQAIALRVIDSYLEGANRDWAAEFLEIKQRIATRKAQHDEERSARRAKNTKPSLPLADYAGTYVDKMYGTATIELTGGQLELTLQPTRSQFLSPMTHWHHDTFRIKFKDEFLPEGFVTFNFNADGDVTGFKIDLPNPDFHFFNLDFQRTQPTH